MNICSGFPDGVRLGFEDSGQGKKNSRRMNLVEGIKPEVGRPDERTMRVRF